MAISGQVVGESHLSKSDLIADLNEILREPHSPLGSEWSRHRGTHV